jgi:CheY-like chemotaxis protein
MERTFRHVADGKGLSFKIDIDPSVPSTIYTDAQRLDQVLKNLLSNAFKFTERGQVELRVTKADSGWSPDHPSLKKAKTVFAFSVSDSGIGIPSDKQTTIFEAFQQADGSTSRRYGGTGLGLAISRELAHLLGGDIRIESEEGRGSTFTLYLPDVHTPPPLQKPAPASPRIEPPRADIDNRPQTTTAPADISIPDDRRNILPGEKCVLIMEDDDAFAQWLLDAAHAKDFKAIVTPRGQSGLALAREFNPAAITLDITLPDVNGWHVLDRLKSDLETRHIPVFIISVDEEPTNALKQGALCFLTKPVDKPDVEKIFTKAREMSESQAKNLLVIEDNETERESLRILIGNETAKFVGAATASEGLAALDKQQFDCVVLDLMLPDMSGFDVIGKIRGKHEHLPIIVYTAKDLSREEEEKLNRVAQTVIVKDVRSPERLYDQTALWLHRDAAKLPEEKRAILKRLHDPDAVLAGKKVLIVDDDIRNIFAMTSMLERYKMNVISAETGKAAIESLQNTPGIDLVLMDIMLPEMDGYETMRAIRSMYGFAMLPIIALTAKAMRGDREKCIDAGASDYIAKPVDTDRLLTLLRTWLHR